MKVCSSQLPPCLPRRHAPIGGDGTFDKPRRPRDRINAANDQKASQITPSFFFGDSWVNGTMVQSLDSTRFTMVREIAKAGRNRGKVNLMWDNTSRCYVSAKIMPNWWIGSCHSEFIGNHPGEIELPWQDIGCIRFLNSIGYPLACQLLGVYRDEDHTMVVTSYATEGDLFMWLSRPQAPPPGPGREELIRPLVMQLFLGVQKLHDLGIVHRDISLENVLISKPCSGNQDAPPGNPKNFLQLRIIDFAMAATQRYFSHFSGSKRAYRAPESHAEASNHVDGFLSDSFAIGVVLYCALVSDYPWLSTAPGEDKCFECIRQHGFRFYLKKRTLRIEPDTTVASVLSEPAICLLEGLLQIDPAKRLSLGETAWRLGGCQRRSVWDEAWLQQSNEQSHGRNRVPEASAGR